MISRTFYTSDRLVKQFFNKTVPHFPSKDRIRVVSTTDYPVSLGDTLYSISREWFGEDGERHWTIIADINGNRKPDDLTVGEIIKLPVEIIAETNNRLPSYEQSSTIPATV